MMLSTMQQRQRSFMLRSAQVRGIGGDTWLVERVSSDEDGYSERPEPIIAGIITSDATFASNLDVAALVAAHGRLGAPHGGYATQSEPQRYGVNPSPDFTPLSDWNFTTTAELHKADTLTSVLVDGLAFQVMNPGQRAGYSEASVEAL